MLHCLAKGITSAVNSQLIRLARQFPQVLWSNRGRDGGQRTFASVQWRSAFRGGINLRCVIRLIQNFVQRQSNPVCRNRPGLAL
jgi:hypothetical protein